MAISMKEVTIEGPVVGPITIELDPPTEEFGETCVFSGMLRLPIEVDGRQVVLTVCICEMQAAVAQDLGRIWQTGRVAARVRADLWHQGGGVVDAYEIKGSLKELAAHLTEMQEFQRRWDSGDVERESEWFQIHGERVCPHCDRPSVHKAGQETIPPTWVYQCYNCECTWDATMYPKETSIGCEYRLAARES